MKVIVFVALIAVAAGAPQYFTDTDAVISGPRTIVSGPSGVIDSSSGTIARSGRLDWISPARTIISGAQAVVAEPVLSRTVLTPALHTAPLLKSSFGLGLDYVGRCFGLYC